MRSLGWSLLLGLPGEPHFFLSLGVLQKEEEIHALRAQKKPKALRSSVGQALRGFPQRWLQFALVPPLLPLLLLPFVLLSLPVAAAGFLGGAMRLASKGWFCSERKVLPALAGASLLLSPGASPSLGCAKRPLMMEAPGWYFPRPSKSSKASELAQFGSSEEGEDAGGTSRNSSSELRRRNRIQWCMRRGVGKPLGFLTASLGRVALKGASF